MNAATPAAPGRRTISFVIDGPAGKPVTEYDVEHEKELHLIAVRRDFNGFQHVHPMRAEDGTWTAELDLVPGVMAAGDAGTYHLYLDFKHGGVVRTARFRLDATHDRTRARPGR